MKLLSGNVVWNNEAEGCTMIKVYYSWKGCRDSYVGHSNWVLK